MAIDKLRYFAAVAETKNLRKAAELVGITPGSMSKAISTLEGELGVKLLRPEGRGIEITDQGWQVYRKSSHLLDEYRRFLDGFKNMRLVDNEQIRIASFEVFSSYFLASFFTKEYPNHEAFLLELTPGKLEAAILDNLVDYGLTYLPSPNSNLNFIEVGQFTLSIWGLKKWIEKPFADWAFAVPISAVQIHSSKYNSLDMWPHEKKLRNIKYRFELLETALRTTMHGASVLHCPDFIIRLCNQTVKKEFQLDQLPYPAPLKSMKPLKVFLVSKKGNAHANILEQKLAKFFRGLS